VAPDSAPQRSRLRIRIYGSKVFKIRWDNDGRFKVVHYDHDDWERMLQTWPAAWITRE
jgi:hypothetical protein